jgi:hypothetical protein
LILASLRVVNFDSDEKSDRNGVIWLAEDTCNFFNQNFFIGMKLQTYYLTCDKNLFFCDFFQARLGGTSNIWYDKRRDRGREHNISSHFNLTPVWTSLSSSDKWHSLHHVLSTNTKKYQLTSLSIGFFLEKSSEWGRQLLQKCWDLIGWKISIFWSDFPSESKLTTLIESAIFCLLYLCKDILPELVSVASWRAQKFWAAHTYTYSCMNKTNIWLSAWALWAKCHKVPHLGLELVLVFLWRQGDSFHPLKWVWDFVDTWLP